VIDTISLKDYLWGHHWHCNDNYFWLLDPQGNLFHIHVKTGNILFHYTSPSWKNILTQDNDKLFVLEKQNDSSYQIQAYQFKNKRILWTKSLECQNEPIRGCHILFFTCKDSACYAIDRFNGEILWEYPYSSADVFPYIVPPLKKDDQSSSTLDKPDWIISSFGKPFIAKNTLVLPFYANFQNNIHVIHPQSKELLWKSEKVSFCYRTLDDNIVIGRYDYEKKPDTFVIEKFEPETGELIWSYTALDDATNIESFEYSESMIIEQYLLLTDKSRNIALLNVKQGKVVWGYSSPIYKGFNNLTVRNHLFFIEQPETNSIYCFSTNK